MGENNLTKSVLALLQEAEDAISYRVWPGTTRSRAALTAERLGVLGYAGTGSYTITPLGRAALHGRSLA